MGLLMKQDTLAALAACIAVGALASMGIIGIAMVWRDNPISGALWSLFGIFILAVLIVVIASIPDSNRDKP